MEKILYKDLCGFLVAAVCVYGCAGRINQKKAMEHYNKGMILFREQQWEGALTELKKAKEYNPENDVVLNAIGLAAFYNGRLPEAAFYYKKAIAIEPNQPDYYNNLAASLSALGKQEEAIKYCKKALSFPSYHTPEFAYFNLGTAYYQLRQYTQAKKSFEKSYETNPLYIDPYYQLGRTLIKLSEFEKAIKQLKEAEELRKKFNYENPEVKAGIYYHLGLAYMKLKKYSESIHYLRKVRQEDSVYLEKEAAKLLERIELK
ncbi:MAG: tetratricopeptide repeat protein [bacterium]